MAHGRAKHIVLVVCLSAALLAGLTFLARRENHRVALYNGAGVLAPLVSDWERQGKPTNMALMILPSNYGSSYELFVFTNTILIGGTNYRCLFGLRSARFARDGVLAITPEKVVLWIGTGDQEVLDLGR